MRRSSIPELQYITDQENVPSIVKHGILCRRLAGERKPKHIANEEIIEIRQQKRVPGARGLFLIDYVNLYICARNPMLFKLQAQNESLCILRVSTDVFDLPGVVVTDRNAARNMARFAPSPQGLEMVNEDLVFARYWVGGTLDDDPLLEDLRVGAKCAEVLVPNRVEPRYLLGIRVCSEAAKSRVQTLESTVEVIVDADLFFNR